MPLFHMHYTIISQAAKSEIVRAKNAQKVLDQEQKRLYQRMIEPKKAKEEEEVEVEQKKDNRWVSLNLNVPSFNPFGTP